jgi:secernin
MCDTLCAPGPGGTVFAKNSDRPYGEVQLAVPFGRRATAGCTLRTQYLSIGDTGAHATFLSCPTWLWGAEHGVNEHGVAIGNEKVATVFDSAAAKPGLIGMDLVRLGLERARTADEALDVMTDLLTTHGQGGVAIAAGNEAYDSSFLIADPQHAFILDTCGPDFAAAPAPPTGAAISNRLTLTADWVRASDTVKPGDNFDDCFRDPNEDTAFADVRLATHRSFLSAHQSGGLTAAATVAHLRDHGHGAWGAPGSDGLADPPPAKVGRDFAGVTVCMHVRSHVVTAASMVVVLPEHLAEGAPLRAFVALGSPCVSIYLPAFPSTAAGPPPFIPFEVSRFELWQAADHLRRRVEDEPDAIHAIRQILNPIEGELWAEADDVAERPHLWNQVGASWGPRALEALTSCAI